MRIPKGGVAFFDSGVGGLTVLAACKKQISGEIFYYYGDNTHAPYGNLPPKKIARYVHSAFRRFKRLQVKAVVIACNTATAVCIERLRKKYSFPIIGAEPAVCSAAMHEGEVWVLATRATTQSARFLSLCEKAQKLFPQSKISMFPCDRLAGEIEKNIDDREYDYTSLLPKGDPTAVVLGCTHYIYIKRQIESYYHCLVYDGNEGIAKRLQNVLSEGQKTGKNREKSEAQSKNRDSRPLSTTFLKIWGFLTTKNPKKIKKSKMEYNTNKCLHKNTKKPCKTKEKHDVGRIYFLGKTADYNCKIYKQMFIL